MTKELKPDLEGSLRYPSVKVQLVGEDSNAYNIMNICMVAMKKAGVSKEEIQEFETQAKSGDYDNLLATCLQWVEVS